MQNKEAYRSFLAQSKVEYTVFQTDWWLQAVAGDQWDAVLERGKDGEIIGALPYTYENRYGFRFLRNPLLTPFLGPVLSYPRPPQKQVQRRHYELKVIKNLLKGLPSFSYFNQHWSYGLESGQILYELDYQYTVYYSYRLGLAQPYDSLYQEYDGNVRSDMRKNKSLGYTISDQIEIDDFINIQQATFENQGMTMPYTAEYLKRLDDSILQNTRRSIYGLLHPTDGLVASLYIVFDGTEVAYMLMLGSKPEYRKDRIVRALIGAVIKHLQGKVQYYDFCGSMVPNFRTVFADFGGEPTPYLKVQKWRDKAYEITYKLLKG